MATRQKSEAAGQPSPAGAALSVTWRGKRFALPSSQGFPLEALEAEEEGKHLTALKLILGADRYPTWRALAATATDAEGFSAVVMRELAAGKLVTVALLHADEATVEALDTALLRYGGRPA